MVLHSRGHLGVLMMPPHLPPDPHRFVGAERRSLLRRICGAADADADALDADASNLDADALAADCAFSTTAAKQATAPPMYVF